MKSLLFFLLINILVGHLSQSAIAEVVCVQSGDQGEPSFSDSDSGRCATLEIEVLVPSATEVEAARQQAAEQAVMVAVLTNARRARETELADLRSRSSTDRSEWQSSFVDRRSTYDDYYPPAHSQYPYRHKPIARPVTKPNSKLGPRRKRIPAG